MYELYERVTKSSQYPRGVKKVDDGENPFLDGPCLLCITAADMMDQSAFGMSKQGMRAARLRVRGEKNAGFSLKDFPVRILALKRERDEMGLTYKESVEEFTSKYILPLVSKDGKKIDCNSAMRNMRNVNVITYCDGTLTAQISEAMMLQKMQEMGYTQEECEIIQSQMCLFPIATDRINGTQVSTCIEFKDINDDAVNDNVSENDEELVRKSPIGEALVFHDNSKEVSYYVAADGLHGLKKYHNKGKAFSVCMASVVTKALENSINNSKRTTEFIPVTPQLLTEDLIQIMKRAESGITAKQLMNELDSKLIYGGATRLSEFEALLLDRLDESYDSVLNSERELNNRENKIERLEGRIEDIIKVAKVNCTEGTYKKINLANGWQYPLSESRTIQEAKGDREIIAQLETENAELRAQLEQRNGEQANISRDVLPEDIARADKKLEITTSEMSDAQNVLQRLLNKSNDKGENDGRV